MFFQTCICVIQSIINIDDIKEMLLFTTTSVPTRAIMLLLFVDDLPDTDDIENRLLRR